MHKGLGKNRTEKPPKTQNKMKEKYMKVLGKWEASPQRTRCSDQNHRIEDKYSHKSMKSKYLKKIWIEISVFISLLNVHY